MSLEQPSCASSTANATSNISIAPATLTNGQMQPDSKAPATPTPQTSSNATLATNKPASILASMPSLPSGFSASTEEILRRVSANAAAHAGTPGYEAAREQVLKNYVTSASITSSQSVPTSRGPGRPPKTVGKSASVRAESATRVMEGSATPASAASTASAKVKSNGRRKDRGAAKGAKRKRAESSESEDDSDISLSYTPLPTKTKSGRNVTKPTQFTPVLPPPPTGPRKKRTRRPRETSVCKVCQRGHSPSSNMIVFCDGCNSGYHQYCHQPPIEKEVIKVAEKEWFCGKCADSRTKKPNAIPDASQLVAGPELTREEKKAYFDTLSPSKLGELLLRAIDLSPSLPLFPPNARSLIPSAVSSKTKSTPSSQIALDTTNPSDISSTNKASFSANSLLPITTATLTSSNDAAPPGQSPGTPSSGSLLPNVTKVESEAAAAAAAAADLGDPYNDGYDTDPPAHYPKPGQGLARTLRPESEDLQWLEDDNMDVYSHMYGGDQGLLNGFGADGAMV
ncbi:hypothetical protein IWX90DRAFT_177183 [Phyllosticta citrichinensis]|uniref:PHD-type domain-containing protein n=1 Tax=Phyllosticta citrichinensis TaxID=1130410 RepID=A0ABR1XVT0_9PEZI